MLFHDAGRGLLQLHRPKRTSNSIINLIRNGARKLSGMRGIVNMMHVCEGKVAPAGGANLLDLSISWENVKINQHKEISSQDYLNCRLVILFKFFYYTETTMFILAGQETIYVEEKYKNCIMLRFKQELNRLGQISVEPEVTISRTQISVSSRAYLCRRYVSSLGTPGVFRGIVKRGEKKGYPQ